jgi:thiamine biosynthesis lipoprotein
MAAERGFRAMGTDVHVIVVDADVRLLDYAEQRIVELEERWSRFLPTSEVSALNRNAGRTLRVSPETIELVQRAHDARRATGGLFDPTVLGDVLRAGYDRSFELLGPAPNETSSSLSTNADAIEIEGDTVRLPIGTGFDPGGIGKGLAADIVVNELRDAGATGVCVNLGGDVRVAGPAPDGGAWTIDVRHPQRIEPIARLGVSDGAVATSTTLRRQWTVAGEHRHHLIDPQTGRPSTSHRTFATVVSGFAWAADVLAKALVLDTRVEPFTLLQRSGAEALIIDDDGNVSTTFGLAAFTRRAAA